MTTQTQVQVETPDLIVVDESHFEDVVAKSATLHLQIKGTSYFNTEVAFKRAKELSTLVDALKSNGITEEDFKLSGIRAEIASGIFTKFSSVNYHIEVKTRDLGKMPEVLTTIANGKNAIIDALEWEYPDDQELKDGWLKKALAKATARGNLIAESLDVKIVGVHACGSRFWNEYQQPRPQTLANSFASSHLKYSMMASESYEAPRMRSVDPGFQLSGSERRGVNVSVAFRVA